jgi:hypothetical protein
MQKFRLKGASTKSANQSFGLEGRVLIGSASTCDVVIFPDEKGREMAEITVQESGELQLRQMDPEREILINGIAVKQAGLSSGDELSIGSYRWVLQAPGLRPQKVLTAEAVKPKRRLLPWLVFTLVLLSLGLAWHRSWIIF